MMSPESVRVLLLTVMIGLGASCMQSHDANTVEVRQEDCSTCHVHEFDATAAPPHRTSGFPEACADCHRTAAWQPALAGLHPEAAFRIRSGPHETPCLRCHDLDSPAPSTDGADTTCITRGCHALGEMDDTHREEGGARYPMLRGDGSNRHFCLDSRCHPDGRE